MTSRDREARARRGTNMAGSQPRWKRKRVEGDKEVRDAKKGCISVNIKSQIDHAGDDLSYKQLFPDPADYRA